MRPDLLIDLAGLIGFAAMVTGLALWSLSASLIGGGAALFVGACWVASARPPRMR